MATRDKQYVIQLESYKGQVVLDMEFNDNNIANLKAQIKLQHKLIKILEDQNKSYKKSFEQTELQINRQMNFPEK